ncbi:MAG: L-aspartate oxidase [Microbacterium gubbeenense]|uniref:L-aspartate oxidase n=1 Tax=Microbacterium gubbeenense TaxID=159896 RepID=UPI00040475D2|nr:L-aspartate oxidase [Microbacterium gubbeenense]
MILVVGSGIAGLTAALVARESGAEVVIATKGRIDDANTTHAQGGIAAVVSPDDTHASHWADTLRAADDTADPDAVMTLVEDGTDVIAWLMLDCGVVFDRDADGRLAQGLEAAHSHPRILHAGGDATGAEIERALIGAVRAAGIDVREHTALQDLLLSDGSVVGARLMDSSGRSVDVGAEAVILATGGCGRAYARTTNPAGATGEGIAAAMRAGARVADMEFVQFHPTVLADGEAFLVSEAVRGEGAVLLDDHGRRFAFDAHPDGELAPRDVVARAIADAMAKQRGRPVLLDATGLGAEHLAARFPTIDRAVRGRGLDWARDPIPVAPAAHYLMGGIVTDIDGATSVPGLFAAGEAACTGVHGANRLASNSLLEGAVFGSRAARAASRYRPTTVRSAAPIRPGRSARIQGDSADDFDREALGRVMWEHAGLERDAAGLDLAADRIEGWLSDLAEPSSVADIEDLGLLTVALEIVRAARTRPQSVGAHHRSDPALVPTAA